MADPEPTRDFYLLGAGFSRAVSDAMPLLPELGRAVLDHLGLPQSTLHQFGDSLEQWMSHISVDQPWLSDSDNLVNRANFFRASAAVQACIDSAEHSTLSHAPQEWLLRLVCEMCANSSNVATFNYDLLLERAISHAGRVSTWTDLYAIPLEGRYPAGSAPFLAPNEPPGNVVALYKLHGSTNWAYAGPGGDPSARVVLLPRSSAWASADIEWAARPRERSLHGDLVPMIVPPISVKNPFYGNLSLRSQWKAAQQALQRARSLTVIGFSFPSSDLQVRHFLAAALPNGMQVNVVDLRPDSAAELRSFIPNEVSINEYSGESSVQEFAAATCGRFLRWAVVPTSHNGWDALLTVDGRSAVPFRGEADRPFDRWDDSTAAREWLQAQIRTRWPAIDTAHATVDRDIDPTGGHFHYIAYLPPDRRA